VTTVTAVMPVFNAMPYLQEAVASIVNQTMSDWALIIVNDGSTDGSEAFLETLRDDRIRILRQSNQGPAAAFNHGLSFCSTELVARMDADDISHPLRLEEQLRFMIDHPEVGLVGTQIRPLGTKRLGRASHLPTHHDHIVRALMAGRHALCNPTVMCRTQILRRAGGYRPDGVLEDWAMFLTMGELSQLANLNQALLFYRIHSGSTNTRHMAELRSRIAYACDRARRMQNSQPPISYRDFVDAKRQAPSLRRLADSSDVLAMVMYRTAQAEILGDQQVRGYLRLLIAALLSPATTLERLTRYWRTGPPRS